MQLMRFIRIYSYDCLKFSSLKKKKKKKKISGKLN
jgi:hypothetical protein